MGAEIDPRKLDQALNPLALIENIGRAEHDAWILDVPI
jgi:hypothetical protein